MEKKKEEYSSGESETEFDTKYGDLSNKTQRYQRILFLWRKTFIRSRASVNVLIMFGSILQQAKTYGTIMNLVKIEHIARKMKPKLWEKLVLSQDGTFHQFWDPI